MDRLCGVDIITVLESGSIRGSSCGLGNFVKVRDVKNIREAIKLLIDGGALKELVNEGAFKEASKTDKVK